MNKPLGQQLSFLVSISDEESIATLEGDLMGMHLSERVDVNCGWCGENEVGCCCRDVEDDWSCWLFDDCLALEVGMFAFLY